MTDQLVRLHFRDPDLLVVGLLCTDTARRARDLHKCLPTSAGVFAQGIAAGLGVAGTLAGNARINLQLSCDGPLRGLFVDADARGKARGYVHNADVNFPGGDEIFDASGALGRSGMLSVLRELKDGEFYRGMVAMDHADLARDLEGYYRESEQIETMVQLQVRPGADDHLGCVAALIVQAMPDAEPGVMREVRGKLQGSLSKVLAEGVSRAWDLIRPLQELFPETEPEILADYPLEYFCACTRERSVRAVIAMGREEIEDVLQKDGQAIASCAFCESIYTVNGDELREILANMDGVRPDEEPN